MRAEAVQVQIVRTACWPCAWKIRARGYKEDNSTGNFFRTEREARLRARRRYGPSAHIEVVG